jgi:uncharacterized protein
LSELVLNISRLSQGTHQYTLARSPDDLGLGEHFDTEIKLSVSLEKGARQLAATVEVTTSGMFTCDRCLDVFRKQIATSYTIVYVMDEHPVDQLEQEFDVQRIHPDANLIDLAEDVRQYTLLALPQKLLCRDDCAGLCSICGRNKNHTPCSCRDEEVDPRWLALKQVLKN